MTPPALVALCGLAGSGKTTCAEFLAQEWGYLNIKFASPIKEMLRGLGLTDEHLEGDLKELPTPLLAGHSPRYAMQTLGTEWGRELMGQEFWADMWSQSASKVLGQGGKVVVDDCRFPNELAAVRRLEGVTIGINRVAGRGPAMAHKSEVPLSGTDYSIFNDRGRAHLIEQLSKALSLSM